MSKFHVSEDGIVSRCGLDVRACPRGGQEFHFMTEEVALEVFNNEPDKSNFAKFKNISMDEYSDNIKEIFAEQYPNVGMVTRIYKDHYTMLRKNAFILFKLKGNNKTWDFSDKDARKFTKSTGIHFKVFPYTSPLEFDALFYTFKPLTVEDRILAKEKEIEKLRAEIDALKESI